MNTLAHLVLNLLTLERPKQIYRWPAFLNQPELNGRKFVWPMVWGALIPDLPMVVFYGVEKLVFRQPESYIWRTAYFSQPWSNTVVRLSALHKEMHRSKFVL